MKKIDAFTNRYSMQKTLRFSLIPVGETEENFAAKKLLESDRKLAENYKKVKGYIDNYHRKYIEKTLSKCRLDSVGEYAELYYKADKSDYEIKSIEKLETQMRKCISDALTKTEQYKKMKGKEMVKQLLPAELETAEELEIVKSFYNFTTYFVGFNQNRESLYSKEEKRNTIAYRCINENLPRFLDNAKNFKKIAKAIPQDIEKLNTKLQGICGVDVSDVFEVDYFSFVLAQSGIDNYNNILGGYSCGDGEKVKGLNEYINAYNQNAKERGGKLPFIKPLYKQILTTSETISFVEEKFSNDNDLIKAVNSFYTQTVAELLSEIERIFESLDDYDPKGIFVTNSTVLTNISNSVFGSWSAFKDGWTREYMSVHPLKSKKSEEKYYEKLGNEYNKNESFSLFDIQRLGIYTEAKEQDKLSVTDYYKNAVSEEIKAVALAYDAATALLTEEYRCEKKLSKNDKAIELIKTLLDGIKELEHTLKGMLGSGKEENKDDVFYGLLLPLYDKLCTVDRLYNKVRNHITQKPYSKDKIKLNFENSQLMDGWDLNEENVKNGVILRKDGKYYLAVIDKGSKVVFSDYAADADEDAYEKVEYKLLKSPYMMLPKVFFSARNIDYFAPSERILQIRNSGSYTKGANFNIDDCHTFIDFYKASIEKHEDWSKFNFEFSPTQEYNDISEFFREVEVQGYSVKFKKIGCRHIDELVKAGKLYLFQIYNKDFSEHSRGNKNLHTRYFEMLFDDRNLADVVYQLNGGAEMFYREASIGEKEKIVHPANEPIAKKKLSNKGQFSTYNYDIVKDRRFTKRQFGLHIPLTLNFKSIGQNFINADVISAVKACENNHIIGIDRGERNLIYVSVINEKGEIVTQRSFNIISDNGDEVDYHKLLEIKEKKRDSARKSWGTIENIKELKEGYLSQVIYEICKLVIEYDAVIALEDLNSGFKNSRTRVEKQVYQKFESMLATKLKFLADKNADPSQLGGLLKAYQLTEAKPMPKSRQNGIIFYVSPWLTSKIDPKTGFVNLLNTRYESVAASKSFFDKFDDIRYNGQEEVFEFLLDYSKFERGSTSFRKKWTICSNGERIISFKNHDKNGAWDNKTVYLTAELKKLFEEYGVDYGSNLKANILSQEVKSFFVKLLRCLSNILQLRNSVTGGEIDYIISPVKDKNGEFFDSRNSGDNLPKDADANGAYNIARKALWCIKQLKESDAQKIPAIKASEWLEFVQK